MKIMNRDNSRVLDTRHGSQIRPLIDRTTSDITQCSLAEEVLPPGCSVTPHHHERLEEVYYIVSGNGVMSVGDEQSEVGPGDAIYIPRGTRHTLANAGPEPVKLLLVCGPAFYFEDEILEDGAKG
ncbi:MAG TPA: cupin domain-containing protein [Blastocatellia bacterium]|nr:cupin domain-containing protein [Blastocatellia bacterium]